MRKKKKYKAVFKTRIDFKNDAEKSRHLRSGQTYYFENEREVFYGDIVNEAERIISNDLKAEFQKYTDLSVQEVQAQSVYEGSIEIIFTVVLGFLELKDLYDAVHLLKEIAERHINRKLSDKFGNHFRVDTYVITPRVEDYWRLEKRYMVEQGSNGEVKRDTFFYYLLVANIVLLLIVGVLLFEAVKVVYF